MLPGREHPGAAELIERAVILTKGDVLQLAALPSNAGDFERSRHPGGRRTVSHPECTAGQQLGGGRCGRCSSTSGLYKADDIDQQDAQARSLEGHGLRGCLYMRKRYHFLIESERSKHKLLLNGQEIATLATLDAAEVEANKIANRVVPGSALRFELDFKWTLTGPGDSERQRWGGRAER